VAKVSFTSNLQRHVDCPEQNVGAATVAEALEKVFQANPKLRSYVLDERGSLHRHMAIMVNGTAIRDRSRLTQSIVATDEIYVLQALSGG